MEILIISQIENKLKNLIKQLKNDYDYLKGTTSITENSERGNVCEKLVLDSDFKIPEYDLPLKSIEERLKFNIFFSDIMERVSWSQELELESFLKNTQSYDDIQLMTKIFALNNVDYKLSLFKSLILNLSSKQIIHKIKISNIFKLIDNLIQDIIPVKNAPVKNDELPR